MFGKAQSAITFYVLNFFSVDISYHDLLLQHRIASHGKLQEIFNTND